MPTYNVSKKRGRSKVKISDKREAAMRRIVESYSEDFDVKMSVIQELIPLGLKAVAEELQNEVTRLAGEKWHTHCEVNPMPSPDDKNMIKRTLLETQMEIDYLYLIIIGQNNSFWVGKRTEDNLIRLKHME